MLNVTSARATNETLTSKHGAFIYESLLVNDNRGYCGESSMDK